MSSHSTINADALVIGGGIIGMLTARELQQRGMTVRVIEKKHTGGESSWAGGGILSPLYPWRYADCVNELASWSQAMYQQLADELNDSTGIDPQWTKSGLLITDTLAGDDSKQFNRWAETFKVEYQTLDHADIEKIQPGLATGLEHAIFLPQVAQVRNPRFVRALKQYLIQRQVSIEESCEITGFIVENNRATGVTTQQTQYFAEHIVVASGAWSSHLLNKVNVSIEVKPLRGQMLLFNTRPGLLERIILDDSRYLIPRLDGRILVGSTLEDVGFEKSITYEARESLWHSATRIMPAIEDYAIEKQWAGLRPCSPQGIPIISAHPDITGLYINTGHFRNGVVLGPASAHLMADIITENCTIIEPEPYSI